MACKLVAIYQKYFNENTLKELTAQKIDDAITSPNKYIAVFDIQKFENDDLNEESKMQELHASDSF